MSSLGLAFSSPTEDLLLVHLRLEHRLPPPRLLFSAPLDDDGAPRTPRMSLPTAVAAQDEAMDTQVLLDGEPPYDLDGWSC